MKHTAIRLIELSLIAALVITAPPAIAETTTEAAAVALALRDNPALGAADLNLRAAERQVDSAEAEWIPQFRAALGDGYDRRLAANVLRVSPRYSNQVSLELGLGWQSAVGTGLDFEVGSSFLRRDNDAPRAEDDNLAASPESLYALDATLRLTQPLLRGAGRDVGEASLRAARFSQTAATYAQEEEASALAQSVVNAYWEVWYAQKSTQVTREARLLAERQLAEAEARVESLGTLARADALRFATELAAIEEDLTSAESELRTRAVELGRLLNLAPERAQRLLAADEAPDHVIQLHVDEALELARFQSAALRELQADVAATQDRVSVAEDATLPRLDLTASLSVGGLWDSNALTAAGTAGAENGDFGVLAGLSLELPVNNRQARANLAEARIRADAAALRLEARTRQLETEVVTALERYETAQARVALAEQTLSISRELAEAEAARLELGAVTAFQVLEAQESLRRAELRRLRALVDRTKAAVTVQHLTGQLLSSFAEA